MENIDFRKDLPIDGNKCLRVNLVPMPSGDNPWHTQEDYIKDKKRDNIKFWIIIGGFIISLISATVSVIQAIETRNDKIKTEQTLKENQILTGTVAKIYVENILGRGRLSGEPSLTILKEEISKLRESLSRAKLETKNINEITYPLEKRIENDLKRNLYDKSSAILRSQGADTSESLISLKNIVYEYNKHSSKDLLIKQLTEKNAYTSEITPIIQEMDNYIKEKK